MNNSKRLFILKIHRSNGQDVYISAFEGEKGFYSSGHNRIDIVVRHMGRTRLLTIFPKGQLYCRLPRGMPINGIAAKEMVLACVSMKPGDTDGEYFHDYSRVQLAWAKRYGEEIDMFRLDTYCDPETGECET